MNRNEAKIFASIPREKLAVIEPKLDKYYDLICAFANGAEIEFKDSEDSWVPMEYLSFSENEEYRVKPCTEKPAKPWKPKDGELYFCVKGSGDIVGVSFHNDPIDNDYAAFGNCFRTRAEAEAACERVRAALKGSTISKTETVEPIESLDGDPLTDGEKDLIRALRVSGIDGIFTEKNSCLFDGGGDCGDYTQYSDFVAFDTNVPVDIKDIISALFKLRAEYDKAAELKFC